MPKIIIFVVYTSVLLICLSHGADQLKNSTKHQLVAAAGQGTFRWPGFLWFTSKKPSIFIRSTLRSTRTTPQTRTTSRIISAAQTLTRTTKPITTTQETTSKVTTVTSTTSRILTSGLSSLTPTVSAFTTFQVEALTQTNTYRATHCAPNLILNSTLNSIAQAYANKLAATQSFQHSNNGYGENLWATFTSQILTVDSIDGATPVTAWYNEVADYKWSSPGYSSSTGHFTQLVWVSTQQLGTGVACTSNQKSCYVVANYWPPGNYQSRFPANVLQASSCNG